MPSGLTEARDQVLANLSGLPHYAAFAEHRQRSTALALEAASGRTNPSLCVLGAGNCFDLDLDVLAERYATIHLVDLDAQALQATRERHVEATRARLVSHAPLDLSGLLDRIDRWARFELTPAELMAHGEATARQLGALLPGPFDVVLSSCVLSQMHLSVLNVLGELHPFFQAVRLVLSLTHLRTLAQLTRPGGSALLATDVSSYALHPLDQCSPGADCRALLNELSSAGKVFAFAEPSAIAAQLHDDPTLQLAFGELDLRDAWVWNNGPHMQLLVYAIALPRR